MTLSSSDNDFSEDIDLYKIILSDDFMSKFSKFDSIDDFFNSSNFDITTEEGLIPMYKKILSLDLGTI